MQKSMYGMNKMAFGSQHIQAGYSIKSRQSLKDEKKYVFPSERRIGRILRNLNNKVEFTKEYDDLLKYIKDGSRVSEQEAQLLVQAASANIEVLYTSVSKFVETILRIKWINFQENVVFVFQKFLVNLASAHNYYMKYILKGLVSNFVTGNPEWTNGIPSSEDFKKFENIHFVINQLLTITPMCSDLLVQCLSDQYPYLKKTASCQEIYVHNLLLILVYAPNLRLPILQLIISKLIMLDVMAPEDDLEKAEEVDCEHIFEMDEDGEDNGTKHPIGRSLDFCLEKVFNYFTLASLDMEQGEFDWEKIKSLYEDMITVFDKIILPTYNIRHVQFVMFFLCSFKPAIAEAFINYLWTKVCTPSIATERRNTAATYLASLIARGSFITIDMLKITLQQMSNWIHSYIRAQGDITSKNIDFRRHTVFYSICQGLFYIIAFRHTKLVNTTKNIQFLETLNLLEIVTSRLNPLLMCQTAIVQGFAKVMQTYQIVYCASVIEGNSRDNLNTVYRTDQGVFEVWNNCLDAFFPFDPYLLKRSGQKIKPIFLEYKKIEDPNLKKNEVDVHETDEFLFFGSSPGFKNKT